MKKRNIFILSLLLAISLSLSSCSVFSPDEDTHDGSVNIDQESDTDKKSEKEDGQDDKQDDDLNEDREDQEDDQEDSDDQEDDDQEGSDDQEDDEDKEDDDKSVSNEEVKKDKKSPSKKDKDKKAQTDKKSESKKDPVNNNKVQENKKPTSNSKDKLDKNTPAKTSKDLKVGQAITTNKTVGVYTNAEDAKNRTNSIKTYPAGEYFVYKIHNGIVNISRSKNSPGAWINPEDINISISSGSTSSSSKPKPADKTQKPSSSNSASQGAKYSWSWLYPGDAGKLLSKYGGVYRLSSGKNIYLTFDNGYEYKTNTSKILDSLANTGVKAVFFTTSPFMKENPALIRRMVNEGHIVGNHTQKHLNHNKASSTAIKADLVNWEKDYAKIVGSKPSIKLFRPPEGKFNETSLKIAQNLGYKTVLWGFGYGDWDTANQPAKKASLNKLLNNNRPGNVLLLHAISDTNVSILESYIQKTREQGYKFSLLN